MYNQMCRSGLPNVEELILHIVLTSLEKTRLIVIVDLDTYIEANHS